MIGGEPREERCPAPPTAAASTEPPTVIGGEKGAGAQACVRSGASTEPPTVIGGEQTATLRLATLLRSFNGAADGDRRRGERRAPRPTHQDRASTEPPTVIGGEEQHAKMIEVFTFLASTEPPTVIGGEARRRRGRNDVALRFNGAADGDRRRALSSHLSRYSGHSLQRSRRR